ncbi:MAG: hypothetical protein JSU69_08260 [Candidatus Zixiibacteriota bacterium]|nr:MAG: hypothetical protein JSU69_08260 [candidate division Zixibacteria bacterium]
MAEKKDSGAKKENQFDPDKRFKYVGFEVHPGKIKDLFKSEAERERWVNRVREKRKAGAKVRDKASFDVPRVAGYEKIILSVTSVLLLVSLFLPWFSGYHEYEVETAAVEQPAAVLVDSLEDEAPIDSAAFAEADTLAVGLETGEITDSMSAMAATEDALETETTELEKDESGFASITSAKKRKEIRKEHQTASAIASLGTAGMVLSSGAVLKITGILFIIYMLFCVFGALYTLYNLYLIKGDPDTRALKLKKALKYNWIPIGIWIFSLIVSFVGASYSFDTSDLVKQIGSSYGIGTFLGLLGYGFYISLFCFIMNAVKAVEI